MMEEVLNQLKKGQPVMVEANGMKYWVARGDLIHTRTIEEFFLSGYTYLVMKKERARRIGLNTTTEKWGPSIGIKQPPTTHSHEIMQLMSQIIHNSNPPISSPGPFVTFLAEDNGTFSNHAGAAEIAVDLCELSGGTDVSLISLVTNKSMKIHPIGIEMVKLYRMIQEPLIERVVTTNMPTDNGFFLCTGYREKYSNREHLLFQPHTPGKKDTFVGVYIQCHWSDIFKASECRCRSLLEKGLTLAKNNQGAFIYLRHNSRHITPKLMKELIWVGAHIAKEQGWKKIYLLNIGGRLNGIQNEIARFGVELDAPHEAYGSHFTYEDTSMTVTTEKVLG